MRNCINIKANDISFKYLLEYSKNNTGKSVQNIEIDDLEQYIPIVKYYETLNDIKLFKNDINYYRNNNDWYSINKIKEEYSTELIPKNIKLNSIKLYIPTYSISNYLKNIKYALSVNTWINGKKIDLGTYIFKPTDTLAIPSGCIKDGNNEYYEFIEFDIIDPFYLIYSDEWDNFRKQKCFEEINTNNCVSNINISLFIVEEYNDSYIIKENLTGGYTNFSISDNSDYLELKLNISQEPLGFDFNISMNTEYKGDLIEYLKETYYLTNIEDADISFELVIKDNNSIIFDPNIITIFSKDNDINTDKCIHKLVWSEIGEDNLIKTFFNDWNTFTETYSFVGSVIVYDKEKNEVISLVSNEIPITQEIFSIFTNGGNEKIIDISDMKITTYNVINKIENNITTIERPNESKSNIIQPVFFRVKETEILTLHPAVTENICINLDQYKSKVDRFTLKIGDNYFYQIGANNYGIIFKVHAHSLPNNIASGIYYILDDNKEVITTGKYNIVI